MSNREITPNDNRNLIKQIRTDQNDKETRLNDLATVEYNLIRFIHLTDYLINQSIDNTGYTTPDLRPTVGAKTKAVLGNIYPSTIGGIAVTLTMSSSDDTLDAYSQQYRWEATAAGDDLHKTQFVIIPLGSDGKIKFMSSSGTAVTFRLVCFAVLE